MTGVELRSAADRFVTATERGESRHCFSFGAHYDPDNTSFGLLVALNEELVAAGSGFDEHPHRDVEIVTWVLDGTLAHQDSTGRTGTVRPGTVQRMSAGSGVVHTERAADAEPVRFVQSWVQPAELGGPPEHEQLEVSDALAAGGLVVVASGRGHPGAVRLRQPDAVLHVARLAAGQAVELPTAPFVHLYVALGSARLGHAVLAEGGTARITDSAPQRIVADDPAEVLVWEMHSALGGGSPL